MCCILDSWGNSLDMLCQHFHPVDVSDDSSDDTAEEKHEKFINNRLNLKSRLYPHKNWNEWHADDKWNYFANYTMFGDYDKIEPRQLMGDWHKILWNEKKIEYKDALIFMDLCKELIEWIIDKRVTEMTGYHCYIDDNDSEGKEFWLLDMKKEKQYVWNQKEMINVIYAQFPSKINFIRCLSCLNKYYCGYPGMKLFICDICWWQFISQQTFMTRMTALTLFLDLCWLNPGEFDPDTQKRLEKKMSIQIDFFKYRMSTFNLYFYGESNVDKNKEEMEEKCEKLPEKFTFWTMNKDEEMDIDI